MKLARFAGCFRRRAHSGSQGRIRHFPCECLSLTKASFGSSQIVLRSRLGSQFGLRTF
jgi:hypothetical protein